MRCQIRAACPSRFTSTRMAGTVSLRQLLLHLCLEPGHALFSCQILVGFREDLAHFLPFVDLMVLPSYTEGLPNVVLEAFAAGVPVVATAVGGTPELVEHGVSGYLAQAGDAAALADRIRDVFASEARRREMGIRGRQRVLEDFTFEAQSLQYQALFESLASPLRPVEGRCKRAHTQRAVAPIQ